MKYRHIVFSLSCFLLIIFLTACGSATSRPTLNPTLIWMKPSQPPNVTPLGLISPEPKVETLGGYAQKYNFYIGVAVDNGLVNQVDYARVLGREFNILVTENAMKFSVIHPGPDRYDFTASDEIVNFALAHEMKVRGHNLVWQQMMPDWLQNSSWKRDQLMEVLHQHISTVVGRYHGQIYAWDVVNEALTTSGDLQHNFWYQNIGPDYLDLAFQWAHEADPDALLFYNDYSAESMNKKAEGVYNLVKNMKARGIPINGIGLEFHEELGRMPPLKEVTKNMNRLGSLGVQVHITELDIRIPNTPTPAQLAQQAQEYQDILKVCLAAPNCTAFMMWGMTDKYSWIPNYFPGYGSALIFDANYQPKPAYKALLDVLTTSQDNKTVR